MTKHSRTTERVGITLETKRKIQAFLEIRPTTNGHEIHYGIGRETLTSEITTPTLQKTLTYIHTILAKKPKTPPPIPDRPYQPGKLITEIHFTDTAGYHRFISFTRTPEGENIFSYGDPSSSIEIPLNPSQTDPNKNLQIDQLIQLCNQ